MKNTGWICHVLFFEDRLPEALPLMLSQRSMLPHNGFQANEDRLHLIHRLYTASETVNVTY